MLESTFIFIIYFCAVLFIFLLGAGITEFIINYKARQYSRKVQNKVLTIESMKIKGK